MPLFGVFYARSTEAIELSPLLWKVLRPFFDAFERVRCTLLGKWEMLSCKFFSLSARFKSWIFLEKDWDWLFEATNGLTIFCWRIVRRACNDCD